jgi:hypothetical protein
VYRATPSSNDQPSGWTSSGASARGSGHRGLVAGDDQPRPPPGRVEVGQRGDGGGEQRLGADGGEGGLEPAIGRGADRARAVGFGEDGGIDEQRGHPRDVEELGAHGVLDLALLALVDEAADEADGDQRDDREQRGQPHAQPAPRRQGTREAGRHGRECTANDRRYPSANGIRPPPRRMAY